MDSPVSNSPKASGADWDDDALSPANRLKSRNHLIATLADRIAQLTVQYPQLPVMGCDTHPQALTSPEAEYEELRHLVEREIMAWEESDKEDEQAHLAPEIPILRASQRERHASDVLYPNLSIRAALASEPWSRTPFLHPPFSPILERSIRAQDDRAQAAGAQSHQNHARGRESDLLISALKGRLAAQKNLTPSPTMSTTSSVECTYSGARSRHRHEYRRYFANQGTYDDPIQVDSDEDQAVYIAFQSSSARTQNLPRREVRPIQKVSTGAKQSVGRSLARPRREQCVNGLAIDVPSTHDCVVCGESSDSNTFPVLDWCVHLPQTCADCYKTWIASELASKGWNDIKCPGEKCTVRLSHYDVQQYAAKEIYNRYTDLSARSALDNDPNFWYCRAPSCRSGQIHIREVDGNIFQCVHCGFRVCLVHSRTSHDGETCTEYDKRARKQKDEMRWMRRQILEEEASIRAVRAMSKKCPNPICPYHIQKNNGCDHMKCSKCRHQFCWNCLMPWDGVHALTCRRGEQFGRRDHYL